MATPILAGTKPVYSPGKTLGRSHYAEAPADAIGRKIAQLDALLCVVCGEGDEEGLTDFMRMNSAIQLTVLNLASDLAEQVHELHAQLELSRG